jgi:hypothetical protein
MVKQESFYVKNYYIYGEGCRKVTGMTKKESQHIKDKYREKGVFLLPDRKIAEESMPLAKGARKRSDAFSAVQFAIASLDPFDQNKIVEIAKNMPDPKLLMDQTIALQQYRVKIGVQNEFEQGRLLDSTEAAIGNLVNMIQAKNNIEEGQELNINVNNSLTALLDEIDSEEEMFIDIDSEKKKEEIKEMHDKHISDFLDEV